MPVRPIADLSELDLSQVVVPQDHYRKFLRQTGRFELIDGVLHIDIEGGIIVGFKELHVDDWWAEDHIPGRPLFPGCLMLEGAAQVTTYHFMQKRPDLHGAFIGFSSIEKTRFRAPVEPPCRLVTIGRLYRMRSRLFTYEAQGFVGDEMVFEALVSGMVIETAAEAAAKR